jgi:hypothetical protein
VGVQVHDHCFGQRHVGPEPVRPRVVRVGGGQLHLGVGIDAAGPTEVDELVQVAEGQAVEFDIEADAAVDGHDQSFLGGVWADSTQFCARQSRVCRTGPHNVWGFLSTALTPRKPATLLCSALNGTAVRYAAEKRDLAASIRRTAGDGQKAVTMCLRKRPGSQLARGTRTRLPVPGRS